MYHPCYSEVRVTDINALQLQVKKEGICLGLDSLRNTPQDTCIGTNFSVFDFYFFLNSSSIFNRNKTDVRLVDMICQNGSNFLGDHCENKKIDCNLFHKYRTFNGSCNNIKNPHSFGVAYTPFRRMLPPDYTDGKYFLNILNITTWSLLESLKARVLLQPSPL